MQSNEQTQPVAENVEVAQVTPADQVNTDTKDQGTPDNGDQGKDPGEKSEKVEEQKSEKKPKQARLQNRLNELTAHRRNAEADAGTVRELMLELTGKEPPKATDFRSTEEYQEAVADYRAEVASIKNRGKETESKVEAIDREYMQTLTDSWEDKVSDTSKDLKDWKAVVSASKVPLTPQLTMAIMESPVGPQIAYYLAKNPEEAHEIKDLSPIGQARRIGRLESKIQDGGLILSEAPVSKAKPPVVPVSGDGAKPKTDLGKDMSLDEYRRARGLIK